MAETSSAVPEPAAGRFLEGLGPRARQRPAPRATIAVAAAGCALAVLGALVVGGDGLAGGDGDANQLPGIVLSAAVVVAGFVLLARFRSGPLATAGTVAGALGIPPLLFFLTFDEGSFPPYSTNAILLISTTAWAVAYAAGPGRGRPFFLGAACIGLWLTVLQLVEGVFDFPFDVLGVFADSTFSDGGVGSSFEPDTPDPTTIGLLSLAFAAGYLVLARRWDRQGFAGAATPLTAAGLVIIPEGVLALADELEATGAGVLTAAIGVAVAVHGASVGRRATTYLGGLGVAVGLLVVVVDLVDEPTPAGFMLMGVGALVVAAAEAQRRAVDEPDELAGYDQPVAF